MRNGHEVDARGPKPGLSILAEHHLLPLVIRLRLQAPVVHGIRDEPADILVHAPSGFEEHASVIGDGRLALQQVIQCRFSGVARVHPLDGLLQQHLVAQQDDVPRARPHGKQVRQRLVLGKDAHPEFRPTGIRFVPVAHDGCSQRSQEEAAVVKSMYDSLLRQSYVDRQGRRHRMTAGNILVVAPYNMQVNLLKQTLPDGARVGTVDKFQGQEAEAVIVSMATSSGDYLPRFMEFLYSKNRLNVALSRARCLALLVASPELMTIKCNTVEQIELVNTLCWVDEYAGQAQ